MATTDQVAAIVAPLADERGLALYDVEQHQTAGVRDGVRVDRLDPGRAACLLGRADEGTEQEAAYVVDVHALEPSRGTAVRSGRSEPSRWR